MLLGKTLIHHPIHSPLTWIALFHMDDTMLSPEDAMLGKLTVFLVYNLEDAQES